jgi:chaperone modulatory protein CbpM
MASREYFHHVRLDNAALERWVEAGWLIPQQNAEGPRFSDVDLARARLIRDLQELGVNDDSIPIVLALVDQVHGLRFALRQFLSTVERRQQD